MDQQHEGRIQRLEGLIIAIGAGGGGGGGGSLFTFPNRVDLSVNKANVDNAQSNFAVLVTRTGTNAAGAYNGGGIGNKSILGIGGFNGLLLSSLATLDYTWRALTTDATETYVNLIVELIPGSGVFNILVIDSPLFTITPLGGGRFNYAWAAATDNVRIVNDQLVPGYPGSLPVPVVGVPFPPTLWPSRAYKFTDLIQPAFYPTAHLRDASTGDGGLPKAPTITPALLVIAGDSVNTLATNKLVEQIRFNGALV